MGRFINRLRTGPKNLTVTKARHSLRAWLSLPPMSISELSRVAGALLEFASPGGEHAIEHPSDRSIRFYISKGCIDPPSGRGSAASYDATHLVQVLFVKVKQRLGWSLERIATVRGTLDVEGMVREVEDHLAVPWPEPTSLLPDPATGSSGNGTGTRGRDRAENTGVSRSDERGGLLRRVVVSPGVELLVDGTHPGFHRLVSDRKLLKAIENAVRNLLEDGHD